MKTAIYIDGFNLYYGRLKNTPHKWLDLHSLFADKIIHVQEPSSQVEKISFFTADVLGKFASRGTLANEAQDSYHRALRNVHPGMVEVIKGYHSPQKMHYPVYKTPPDKSDKVAIWRLEEKQTDVNIALHAYRDALSGDYEQIVLVTNDADLVPLLKMLREDVGGKVKVGVVFPIKKVECLEESRPQGSALIKYADWTRRHILDEELEASQFPEMIPTKKKPIRKPSYW